jgi:hypothetical protein
MKGTGERAENDLQQRTSEGGSASAEKARESKPSNPDHVMKGTGERAENDLQQRTSESGSASVERNGEQMGNGGRASRMRQYEDDQGAYTTESLEGGNIQYAIDLGFGVPEKVRSYADRKPTWREKARSYDRKPTYDPQQPLGKQMDDAIRRECFKEGKPVCGKGKRKATVALSMGVSIENKVFCTAWKQRMQSWPGGW